MPTPHTEQIGRSFTRALDRAGEDFVWGAVNFRGIRDAAPAPADGMDRNEGDSTAAVIRVLRSAFPGALPRQGESFTDSENRQHRIAEVRHTPGLPVIALVTGNISDA